MIDYREALVSGQKKVAVWGIGHIGYSTMCHFAERGVSVIGTDVDREKVDVINRGENPIFAMDYWLGFTPAYLFQGGVARATTDWSQLIDEDVLVHFICIPTERDGLPYLDILADVCRKITKLADLRMQPPPLVIIESTLTPNTADEFVIPIFESAGLTVGRDVLFGCAPRRDWFSTPESSLRTLARVIGGTDEATTKAMLDTLGIVCENLVVAPDHNHAEVVKSIENAYRHMDIALANQLALAYPHLDMRAVLELVGTKWNMETYFPSFGVGGYCIPLASHYVLQGAERPEFLTLLQATVATSEAQPGRVVDYLVRRGDVGHVGILGLSYTKNMKVWAQSPTVKIAPALRRHGIEVKVNDLHYTDDEIRRISGAEPFRFPDDLGEFDTVLVVAGHREYGAYPHTTILRALRDCRLVLDNAGLWREIDFRAHGIEYHVPGDRQWLVLPAPASSTVPTASPESSEPLASVPADDGSSVDHPPVEEDGIGPAAEVDPQSLVVEDSQDPAYVQGR